MLKELTTTMKKTLILLFTILFASAMQAQLKDFSLMINKTDETCLGNGTLKFTVTNKTQNSTILYKVYVLPDVTNPITVLTTNNIGSLSAATYKIEAIQSLGDQSNRQEKTVTIENKIVPFAIDISTSTQHCAEVGDIIVNATSGTGDKYEIISGPVKRPLQRSNIFKDLPTGTYNIRAYDKCGDAKVKTYTLNVVSTVLAISDTSYPDNINVICDSIKVMNVITPIGGGIGYPLTVQSTLTPLSIGGNPIIVNRTYQTGSPTSLEVSMVVPRYMTESYTYDMKVTDHCENITEKKDNVVTPEILLSLSTGKVPCAKKYLKINASRYTTSYKVKFLKAPDDFNASTYNTTPNGPFTTPNVNYGNEDTPVPFGDYIIEITDLCGRKAIDSIKVEFKKPEPTLYGVNNGCFSLFGYIRASMPESKLVTAIITAAPEKYLKAQKLILPQDVSNRITGDGILAMNDLPLGEYTIIITDECNFTYEVKILVPEYKEREFSISTLPSCDSGFGTVSASSGNGKLTEVEIIEWPSAFKGSKDVMSKIADNGVFYMAELPEGDYTFRATDICGVVKDLEIKIEGYSKPVDAFTFTPNCGTFSVSLNDTSNGIDGSAYWLQYYNEATKTWIHPVFGVDYVEGTVPTASTGIGLSNKETRHNFNYNGTMRVVKKFTTYGDGTPEKTICLSVLGEFKYTEKLEITAAYTLACAGQPNDVVLEILGYPVTYKITAKNGEPFVVDNGASNIFTNLDAAEYKFEIEDACGNKNTKGFNVLNLPSITDATEPSDMIVCAEPGTVDEYEYHLTDQDAAVLGPLHSSMYTITYHLTQADADNNERPLPEFYHNTSNGQTIYVRLVHKEIKICHGTTSFKLFIGEKPLPKITTRGTICNEGKVAITAEAGFINYIWSDGQKGRTIYVDKPDTYTVTVDKVYGDRVCTGSNSVEIKQSVTPTIVKIDTSDWTLDENTITVHAEGSGNFEYSLDGSNYQAEDTFTGLKTGVYQVFVRDGNGCGEVNEEVVLLHYPNFFTPNGDGYHDKWRIEYAVKEPHMKIYIFDRYGKPITSFGAMSDGWDGKLNGIDLPSTDYWFVVTREDGRELKGHFSMLR